MAPGSLWNVAYDNFGSKNPKLDSALREIFLSEIRSSGIVPSENAATKEEELSKLVRREVDRMEAREWKIRIGRESIRIRTQIDRILKILSFVKDISVQAAGLEPVYAGLPVAGLYLILSVISSPANTVQALMYLHTVRNP